MDFIEPMEAIWGLLKFSSAITYLLRGEEVARIMEETAVYGISIWTEAKTQPN